MATLVVGLLGFSTFAQNGTNRPWQWTSSGRAGNATAWPFLRDGFPPGRAWRNGDVTVYVRPKLGFCGNCDTGVVEELRKSTR